MGERFDPEALLRLPLMANLATMGSDGPRNAPVWFLWEDGTLWLLGSEGGSSVRRLEAEPRCAVEIVRFSAEDGVLLHLGLRGSARIRPMAADRFRRLLSKYLGPEESTWNGWFMENVARIDDPAGRLIELVPDSLFTNNVSYFRTGPDFAWP